MLSFGFVQDGVGCSVSQVKCPFLENCGLVDVKTSGNAAVQDTTPSWDDEFLLNAVCAESSGLGQVRLEITGEVGDCRFTNDRVLVNGIVGE